MSARPLGLGPPLFTNPDRSPSPPAPQTQPQPVPPGPDSRPSPPAVRPSRAVNRSSPSVLPQRPAPQTTRSPLSSGRQPPLGSNSVTPGWEQRRRQHQPGTAIKSTVATGNSSRRLSPSRSARRSRRLPITIPPAHGARTPESASDGQLTVMASALASQTKENGARYLRRSNFRAAPPAAAPSLTHSRRPPARQPSPSTPRCRRRGVTQRPGKLGAERSSYLHSV